jgi:hypothetical protein
VATYTDATALRAVRARWRRSLHGSTGSVRFDRAVPADASHVFGVVADGVGVLAECLPGVPGHLREGVLCVAR